MGVYRYYTREEVDCSIDQFASFFLHTYRPPVDKMDVQYTCV
jgi:hypothetical protein